MQLRPISDVAADIGFSPDVLTTSGSSVAKVNIDRIGPVSIPGSAKYVIVTSITPTPAGEGKTTVSIGLGQALWKIGAKSLVTLRQASLGPTFGIKGGATGGGKATLEPATDLNMHLTGDFHAVTAAHNACAAFLDNHLHHGNRLGIDPGAIIWPRVLDMNDRALRGIEIGLGGKNGPARRTGYEITGASEVMSILSLATGYEDLRRRCGKLVIGFSQDRRPVTADDIEVAGAMAALLRDALSPNIVQTQESTPVFVHSGPFGNVGLGNSSVIADIIGSHHADIVVTEAGFGTDLGFEKFANVKCRVSGMPPDAAVVVVTVRSMKAHGPVVEASSAKSGSGDIELGIPNLEKHIENVRQYGIPVVVAINRYSEDSADEIERIQTAALQAGADAAVEADVFGQGGEGGVELAEAVMAATTQPSSFRYLYDPSQPLETKIERIAQAMYGAEGVDYEPEAQAALDLYRVNGFGTLPICMAKTQASISADRELKGRPEGFRLKIRDVRLYAGAGYVVPIAGAIMLMPGLGKHPSGALIDLLPDGTIVGLS